MKELEPTNKINRAANVAIAHGVWIGGIYRDHGIPRFPKEKTSFPATGCIPFKKKPIIEEVIVVGLESPWEKEWREFEENHLGRLK